MKKYLSLITVVCMLSGLLAGCGEPAAETDSTAGSNDSVSHSAAEAVKVDFSQTDEDMFTDRDYEVGYDENNAITVTLNGSTATASDSSVKISGSTVTITENATHIIKGSLDDGMIIVDAPEDAKLQLVFNGVNITSQTSAAVYIRSADKVFITLADGTENTLASGESYTAIDDSNIDAALFSKQDLTMNGLGSLTVSAPAGHGIVCKDDLVLTSGIYAVNSASHGIDANDSVRLTNATLTIQAGKDGIHAENSDDTTLGFVYASSGTVTIEAEGDGVDAGSYAQFEGGSFTITAGGGSSNGSKSSSDDYGRFMGGGMGGGMGMGGMSRPGSSNSSSSESSGDASTSMKGIKTTGSLLLSAGSYTINSADDALHANESMTINGGTYQIATGDDAVHAEDTLTITNCDMDITECYEGLEALHIAVSGGDIRLVASDDGLNAAGGTDSSGITGGRDGMFGGGMGMGGGSSNGSIVVSGGNLYINASGDGMDANGTLEISGGYTVVVGPTSGDTATLDYDVSGIITGGIFIGTGASNMAQTFSASEQGVIAVQVGNQSPGTTITLTDSGGNTVVSYTPELSFQVVIISTPDMVSGDSYTISLGSISETFQAS